MPIMHSLYREAGRVEIDPDKCTQCAQCAEVCPADVFKVAGGRISLADDSPFGCIACGHCMMVCPQGSIRVTGRGVSPDDLRPLPAPEQRATSEALAALMAARRSVRRFRDREVEPDKIDRIIEMAASAPMGVPPWDIGCVAVHGRDRVRRLAGEIVQGYMGFLRLFRPWVLALMRPFLGRAGYEQFRHFIRPLAESIVKAHGEGRDVLFWDAPALLIFHHSPYSDLVDAAIPCTYAMLAAESLGLGTVLIGSAPPILARNRKLASEYGIPQPNKAALLMLVGYPAVPFKRGIERRFASVRHITGC